jgi:hypothetical protein
VPQQLADEHQTLPAAGGDARKAVAQVVEPHIIEARALPDALPRLLQID